MKTRGRFKCPTSDAHREFEVYPTGYEIGIVVYEDGSTGNKWADGTIGVTREQFADTQDETEAVCHECGAHANWVYD